MELYLDFRGMTVYNHIIKLFGGINMQMEKNIISNQLPNERKQETIKKFLTVSEFMLLKKIISTDIDEKGNKILVSRLVAKADLFDSYSAKNTYKVKRNLINLQKKNLIDCDSNEDIAVNENGIKQYTKCKKITTLSIPAIVVLSLIIIAVIICEIVTQGMFFNTYSDGFDTYKFYLTTYKSISYDNNDKKEVSKGTYSISGDTLTLNDTAVEFCKYKNTIFEKDNNSINQLPVKKISKGKYSITETDFLGTHKNYIELNDDSTFGWVTDYDYGSIESRSGDYKIKNHVITFKVKYSKSMSGDESAEDYTLYGVLKGEFIYPYAYIRK